MLFCLSFRGRYLGMRNLGRVFIYAQDGSMVRMEASSRRVDLSVLTGGRGEIGSGIGWENGQCMLE